MEVEPGLMELRALPPGLTRAPSQPPSSGDGSGTESSKAPPAAGPPPPPLRSGLPAPEEDRDRPPLRLWRRLLDPPAGAPGGGSGGIGAVVGGAGRDSGGPPSLEDGLEVRRARCFSGLDLKMIGGGDE